MQQVQRGHAGRQVRPLRGNEKMSNIATVLAWTALLLAGSPAAAAEPMDIVEERVLVADLDLYSSIGRQALDRRIRAAARRLCADLDGRSIARLSERGRCLSAAVASAGAQRDRLFAQRGITSELRTAMAKR